MISLYQRARHPFKNLVTVVLKRIKKGNIVKRQNKNHDRKCCLQFRNDFENRTHQAIYQWMRSWIIYTNCFYDVFIPFSLFLLFVTGVFVDNDDNVVDSNTGDDGGGRSPFLPWSYSLWLTFIQISLSCCTPYCAFIVETVVYCYQKWLMVENSSGFIGRLSDHIRKFLLPFTKSLQSKQEEKKMDFTHTCYHTENNTRILERGSSIWFSFLLTFNFLW